MPGNCATGKLKMVRVPTSTRTIEITMATMGRLIKNFDIELPARSSRGKWFGIHLHTRAHFLDALGNHPVAWLQSIRNNPLAVDTVADFDGSDAHFVAAIHGSDLVAALQLGDRTLRYQQRILLHPDNGANFS